MIGKQLFVGMEKPTPELMQPIKNDGFVKPRGGLWTSTLIGRKVSGWTTWCRSESFGNLAAAGRYVLIPSSSARIYTIDTYEDLIALPLTLLPGIDRVADEAICDHFKYPDFEAIAADFDAIHLTAAGQTATRYSSPGLYGWDCESTLWLRWCFDSVTTIMNPASIKHSQHK